MQEIEPFFASCTTTIKASKLTVLKKYLLWYVLEGFISSAIILGMSAEWDRYATKF